jgi:hypothetical protein
MVLVVLLPAAKLRFATDEQGLEVDRSVAGTSGFTSATANGLAFCQLRRVLLSPAAAAVQLLAAAGNALIFGCI